MFTTLITSVMCLLTSGLEVRDAKINAHLLDAMVDPQNSFDHFDKAAAVAKEYRLFEESCQEDYQDCIDMEEAGMKEAYDRDCYQYEVDTNETMHYEKEHNANSQTMNPNEDSHDTYPNAESGITDRFKEDVIADGDLGNPEGKEGSGMISLGNRKPRPCIDCGLEAREESCVVCERPLCAECGPWCQNCSGTQDGDAASRRSSGSGCEMEPGQKLPESGAGAGATASPDHHKAPTGEED